ncbi:MAG: hypothetical protein V4479_06210 [Actinomycetota bacterium]
MALLHQATLTPSKLELLAEWLPEQDWFRGEGELERVAYFRFDDPEGEVGVETLLIRAGAGPVLQVPLTYRGSPLEDRDDALIGTMQHSALGPRWVYDGPRDPVYLQTLAVLTGGTQVELWIDEGQGLVQREPDATVTGTGSTGTVVPATDDLDIDLVRTPEPGRHADAPALIGRWEGADGMLLATVAPRA